MKKKLCTDTQDKQDNGLPDLGAMYPDLTAKGWEYRGSGERGQIEELGDFFAELGFETKVKPVRRDAIPPDCLRCPKGRGDVRRYRMLFTRETGNGNGALPPTSA